MSPAATADAAVIAARPNATAASAPRRETKQRTVIRRSFGTTTMLRGSGSSSGDLRIEVDGLRLPLLIKRAILGRHRKRVAILHRGHDALGLRFEGRI